MQQSILFCLIVVKCEKISVEYGVIFLILQQVRRATSWVSAPAGRMLCTPALKRGALHLLIVFQHYIHLLHKCTDIIRHNTLQEMLANQ